MRRWGLRQGAGWNHPAAGRMGVIPPAMHRMAQAPSCRAKVWPAVRAGLLGEGPPLHGSGAVVVIHGKPLPYGHSVNGLQLPFTHQLLPYAELSLGPGPLLIPELELLQCPLG